MIDGVSALNSISAPIQASLVREQADFGRILSRARADGPTTQQDIRAHAEEFVSSALVQPVLKLLRESNQAAAPFKPSAGEKSFRGMLDAAWANQLVRSGNWELVDRIAKRFAERGSRKL
jgi:hypothetical protein